jgi:type IV pilus assembly protein PilB
MLIAERFKRDALATLGERLVRAELLTEEDLQSAEGLVRQKGGRLAETIVGMGLLTAKELGPHLQATSGFPFIDIAEEEIDAATAVLLPEAMAIGRQALPFAQRDGQVLVAMADPMDLATVDALRVQIARPIAPHFALGNDLAECIRRVFNVREKMFTVLEEIGDDHPAETEDPGDALLDQADDAPIVRLVNSIMVGAFASGASDIHIEPKANNVRIRYRIDGLLYDQMTIPSNHLAPTISRLKVMSRLDIAEKRRPQDGRFSTRDENGREYDVRLSVLPTVHGQKACMRLLEKTGALPDVATLGLQPNQEALFHNLIQRPHGLLLVTGPTGSGKTTTLYSALRSLSDSTRNINTVEDPVEYELPEANQVQVNPKIGLTFASGLRSLLRQDPDIILIGEIRDRETAEIAIESAMTGHFVLSTLHTNDAPSALVRLQNMRMEPYMITSSVVGVIGQRLLRKLCPLCKETYKPSEAVLLAAGLDPAEHRHTEFARGAGCRRCGGRGMRGRVAVYEVMPMSEEIRQMVLNGASGSELAAQAAASGMATMRQSAIQKVLDHTTSPEEVHRVFSVGE